MEWALMQYEFVLRKKRDLGPETDVLTGKTAWKPEGRCQGEQLCAKEYQGSLASHPPAAGTHILRKNQLGQLLDGSQTSIPQMGETVDS
jgi:hypothetical protein